MILKAARRLYGHIVSWIYPEYATEVSEEAKQRARGVLPGVKTCFVCGGMITEVVPARETITGKLVHPLCLEFERQRRRLR